MSTNIARNLKKRSLNSSFSPETFVTANCFNETMINRMKVEHKIPISHTLNNDLANCGSWNSSGMLLSCGLSSQEVNIYQPFQQPLLTTIPNDESCCLADALFMTKHENLLATATKNRTTLNYTSGLSNGESVKIWDIETNKVTRKYEFKGHVSKLCTSKALPHHVWYDVDPVTRNIAEADTRTPKFYLLQLTTGEERDRLFYHRCFEVNPVDEVTVVVGDKNTLFFHDRNDGVVNRFTAL